jgi:deoxycytidine triphosphate deaminase
VTVLSDCTLTALYPEYRGTIGPASIDLAIGGKLWVWPRWIMRDPRVDQSELWRSVALAPIFDQEDEPVDEPCWILKPGVRYLAATAQRIKIPDDCAGQIGARSSWGRDGLAVICGPAGWIDPGYVGNPTLELSVVGSELVLWPGAVVAQLILHRLDRACERPYDGRYQHDSGPVASRLWMEARP